MKKQIALIVAIVCLGKLLTAQPFLPIVKENAIWNQGMGAGALPDPITYWNWTYEIIGDTTISNLQY